MEPRSMTASWTVRNNVETHTKNELRFTMETKGLISLIYREL